MAWTPKQRTTFLAAVRAAGWNDDQRYIAMRHCGCPLKAGTPSVTHPRNDNAAFERCMALAESCAGQRGERIAPPRGKRSWREAERAQGDRLRDLARRIAAEARRSLPQVFPASTLAGTIRHVCGEDDRAMVDRIQDFRDDDGENLLFTLDPGQLYRVVESLKAHVGRVFLEHGITPASFTVPASAKRRALARAAMEGVAG